MDSDQHADLCFELADVLNDFVEVHDLEPEDVRENAMGYLKGWRDGGSP